MESPLAYLGHGTGGMQDQYAPELLPPEKFLEEVGTDTNEPFCKAVRAGRAKELNAVIEATTTDVINSIIPYNFVNGSTTYTGIIIGDGPRLWKVTGGTKTALTLPAGITGTVDSVWRGFGHGAGIYLVNGHEPALFWDGTTLVRASIFKPALTWSSATYFDSTTAETGGQLGVGLVYIRLTYENTGRGSESNPSAASDSVDPYGTFVDGDLIGTFCADLSGLAGTNNEFTLTITAAGLALIDAQVDRIHVYRTAVGGTEFYHDGYLAVPGSGDWVYSNVTSGRTDVALVMADEMPDDHDDVPVTTNAVGYERRLWYFGQGADSAPYTGLGRNYIVFSAFDYPEYVRYLDQASDSTKDSFQLNEDTTDMVGGVDFGDELFLATGKSCYNLIGNGSDAYQLTRVAANVGAVSQKGFARREQAAFFVSTNGIYEYYRGTVTCISDAIQKTWDALNADYLSGAVLCYYPAEDKLYCAVPGGATISPEGAAQTSNNLLLVCEFMGGQRRWKVWDGIYLTDMCVATGVASGDTTDRLYGICSYNFLWRLETVDCEAEIVGGGGSTGTKTAVLVAADTISNTEITDASATFYTTGGGLSGCTVWVWDAAGQNRQIRRIASNTATKLTVNSAWTVNPATGWTYAVGGIHYRVKTGAAQLGSNPFHQANVTSISIQHRRENTDTAVVYASLYLDSSATATAAPSAVNVGDATEGNYPACDVPDGTSQGHNLQVSIEGVFVDRSFKLIAIGVYYEPVDIHD